MGYPYRRRSLVLCAWDDATMAALSFLLGVRLTGAMWLQALRVTAAGRGN